MKQRSYTVLLLNPERSCPTLQILQEQEGVALRQDLVFYENPALDREGNLRYALGAAPGLIAEPLRKHARFGVMMSREDAAAFGCDWQAVGDETDLLLNALAREGASCVLHVSLYGGEARSRLFSTGSGAAMTERRLELPALVSDAAALLEQAIRQLLLLVPVERVLLEAMDDGGWAVARAVSALPEAEAVDSRHALSLAEREAFSVLLEPVGKKSRKKANVLDKD